MDLLGYSLVGSDVAFDGWNRVVYLEPFPCLQDLLYIIIFSCFPCYIHRTFCSEHKYEIVKRLQARKHICGMTGDGVNDAPALKKADIGIAVADATDAARSASDIVLTEPGLSVIISAVLTSRAIFQRMKNYTVLHQRG